MLSLWADPRSTSCTRFVNDLRNAVVKTLEGIAASFCLDKFLLKTHFSAAWNYFKVCRGCGGF